MTYFALGRAILKGFTLYQDIYDSKPPGIFLLSAASLTLTGNELLANIAQAFAFLLVTVFIVALAWNESRPTSTAIRRSALFAGFFVGLVLTQYTALRSGGNVQTEPIGSVACLAYIFLLTRNVRNFRLRHVFLATLCMTLAVGIKEPFILIFSAVAILFCPSVRSFLRAFVFPTMLTALIGILTLSALGSLRAYFTFSLPELLFGSYTFAHISPWIGAFNFLPIIFDFWKFSPAFLFLTTVIIVIPILLATPEHRPGTIAATLGLFIVPALPFLCLILWAGFSGLPFSLRAVLLLPLLQGSRAGLLLWLVVFITGMIAYGNVLLLRRRTKKHWRAILFLILRFIVALLITFGVVGLRGKYYPHYFIFALPLLAASFTIFLRSTIRLRPQIAHALLGSVSILAAVILILLPSRNLPPLQFDLDRQRQDTLATAARFDALLDSCKFKRYLAYAYETEPLWAFTQHTPYGSSFSHMTWTADRTSSAFKELYAQRFAETRIIVLDPYRLPELEFERGGTLWNDFSRSPPACAASFMPIDNFLLLFRKTPTAG